jgi:hypothetical protein
MGANATAGRPVQGVRCGNCKHRHPSRHDVKACYEDTRREAEAFRAAAEADLDAQVAMVRAEETWGLDDLVDRYGR